MNFRPRKLLQSLGLAALTVGMLVACGGCKGNSAPPPTPKVAASPPPALHLAPALSDPMAGDLLTNRAWQTASWFALCAPTSDARIPPATRVAGLYTPGTAQTSPCLYFAFLNAQNEAAAVHEDVEIWLDTSAAQNGTELYCLAVEPTGITTGTWFRASHPAQPKEDGSPNFNHPLRVIPNHKLLGLDVRVGRAQIEGQPAWSVVVALPLKDLPTPLRVSGPVKEGARWHANLLRVQTLQRSTLQANYSPVPPSCQQLCPYRLSELVLDPAK